MSSFDSVRERLAGRLEQLQTRQGKVERDLRRPGDPDAEEQAAERANDEVLEDLDERGRDEIVGLQRAIARIDAGTYGTCEGCGEPIPEARLEAVPYATRCVECAT